MRNAAIRSRFAKLYLTRRGYFWRGIDVPGVGCEEEATRARAPAGEARPGLGERASGVIRGQWRRSAISSPEGRRVEDGLGSSLRNCCSEVNSGTIDGLMIRCGPEERRVSSKVAA